MSEIHLDLPYELFNNHINNPSNKQILFSAPFGYGKTYFLNDYFDRNENLYNTFWLSPVRYVVGQNEDIFEYIKIDIILKLITFKEILGENLNSFSNELYLHKYLKENPNEASRLILEAIERTEIPYVKGIAGSLAGIIKAKETFESWKKQAKEDDKNDFQKLHAYTSLQLKVKGSIFEDDVTTELIRGSLQIVKGEKENILIIDDFDRLDPEHIFRILNILSIHQYHSTGEDKFGFDKIVIVCSIKNIEYIYKHKYGNKVDFIGYMEKFFSTEIFHFNNQTAIAYYCQHSFGDELDSTMLKALGVYLGMFVSRGRLSVRSIVKHNKVSNFPVFKLAVFNIPSHVQLANKNEVSILSTYVKEGAVVWSKDYAMPIAEGVEDFYFDSSDFQIIKIIQILSTIFGDFNQLRDELNDLSQNYQTHWEFPLYNCKALTQSVVPFIHYISNYTNAPKLLANIVVGSQLRDNTYTPGSITTLYPPSFTVFDVPITIPVGWTKTNQYDGTQSFYSKVVDGFDDNYDYSKIHKSLQDQFVPFLKMIIGFLQSDDLLKQIGISV